MESIVSLETTISVVVGAAVAWALTHVYYKRAGNELRDEAQRLRRLVSMMLTAMEEQGWAKVNRDQNGEIVGFIFEHAPTGGVRWGGSAPVEFRSGKEQ